MKLKLLTRLDWMIDEESGVDGFAVPESSRQLFVIDGSPGGVCLFVHSLTGAIIELGYQQTTHEGRYQCHGEELHNGFGLTDCLEIGEKLYGVLTASGAPLWATDKAIIESWLADRCFTLMDDGSVLLESPYEREKRWKKRVDGWITV